MVSARDNMRNDIDFTARSHFIHNTDIRLGGIGGIVDTAVLARGYSILAIWTHRVLDTATVELEFHDGVSFKGRVGG